MTNIQYLWEKEINKITTNIVHLKDGTDKVLSDKQLTYMITDEPQDPTQMRDIIMDHVVPDMMQVLIDHNVCKWHVNAAVNAVVGSYNETFNKAVGKAFWTYEEGKPTEFFPENISILDIQRVLD